MCSMCMLKKPSIFNTHIKTLLFIVNIDSQVGHPSTDTKASKSHQTVQMLHQQRKFNYQPSFKTKTGLWKIFRLRKLNMNMAGILNLKQDVKFDDFQNDYQDNLWFFPLHYKQQYKLCYILTFLQLSDFA